MGRIRIMGALMALLFVCSASTVRAQNMPVPATLQAAIFKKVITLDRTLAARQSAKMLVVYGASSAGDYQAVLDAFKSAGLTATAVAEDQLTSQIAQADLVYLLPGATPNPQLSKSKGVLSLTGVPANVESGKASIGIGLKDSKPEIIVHMGQLKAEGHDISADLLKLARVIQ